LAPRNDLHSESKPDARNLPANSSQAHDAEDLAFEFLTDGRLPTTGSDPVAFGDDVTHAR
jgi:hypothetical protein